VGSSRNENLKIAYEFKKYRSEKNKDALDYGMAIHQLFSKINNREDLNEALNESLTEGIISQSEMEILMIKINRIIDLDPVSSWFSEIGEKFLERELVDAEGNLLRPDRIVIIDNKVSVIDYKTGQLNEKKLAKYRDQVNQYAEAFRSMNYIDVKGYIIAIDEEKVLEI